MKGRNNPTRNIVQSTRRDLSHRKNDVSTLAATLLNLCNRGGMSSKMRKGRNASKKVGNQWSTLPP